MFDTIMGTDIKMDLIEVSGDSGVSVQPPSGETWIISTIVTEGDGANAGYAGFYDGSTHASYLLNPDYGIGEGDDFISIIRDGKIFIDNTSYLYLFNHSAAAKGVYYSGENWPIMSDREIKADVILAGAASNVTVIPPAGEYWCITTLTARPRLGLGTPASLFGVVDTEWNTVLMPARGIGEGDDDHACLRDGKIFIFDDIYLNLFNNQVTSKGVSYSGVQWK